MNNDNSSSSTPKSTPNYKHNISLTFLVDFYQHTQQNYRKIYFPKPNLAVEHLESKLTHSNVVKKNLQSVYHESANIGQIHVAQRNYARQATPNHKLKKYANNCQQLLIQQQQEIRFKLNEIHQDIDESMAKLLEIETKIAAASEQFKPLLLERQEKVQTQLEQLKRHNYQLKYALHVLNNCRKNLSQLNQSCNLNTLITNYIKRLKSNNEGTRNILGSTDLSKFSRFSKIIKPNSEATDYLELQSLIEKALQINTELKLLRKIQGSENHIKMFNEYFIDRFNKLFFKIYTIRYIAAIIFPQLPYQDKPLFDEALPTLEQSTDVPNKSLTHDALKQAYLLLNSVLDMLVKSKTITPSPLREKQLNHIHFLLQILSLKVLSSKELRAITSQVESLLVQSSYTLKTTLLDIQYEAIMLSEEPFIVSQKDIHHLITTIAEKEAKSPTSVVMDKKEEKSQQKSQEVPNQLDFSYHLNIKPTELTTIKNHPPA